MISRRQFLKSTAIAIGAAITPPIFAEGVRSNEQIFSVRGDWQIFDDGLIKYIGPKDQRYTVLELHRILSDWADAPYSEGSILDITSENPSLRYTDNIIALQGKFHIDDESAEYLYDGSISQFNGSELYSGITVLGHPFINLIDTEENDKENGIFLSQGDSIKYYRADINNKDGKLLQTVLKTKSNGELINDGKVTAESSRKVIHRFHNDLIAPRMVTIEDTFTATTGQGTSHFALTV